MTLAKSTGHAPNILRLLVYRLSTTALLLIGAILLAVPMALAQSDEVAAELRNDPVYVAPGAEEVDRSRLEDAIAAAERIDLDVRVAVFPSGDAEALTADLIGHLPGTTVVVFTASSYGVASDEVSQGRLDDALAAAEDELSGPDAATGLGALVDALDEDGGPSLVLIVVGVVAILLVVGIGGRLWETRTRARRHERRRDRRRADLGDRVMRMGERVVELSDRVELAESAEASRAYAEATDIFAGADRRLAAAATMKDLDAVEADIERAEELLDRAEVAAGA